MKGTIILLITAAVVVAGCLGNGSTAPNTDAGKTLLDRAPSDGDIVTINYVMRVEGELLDTTYEELANASADAEDIAAAHPFGFEPLTFIVGSGHVNPEFSKTVKNMKPGDVVTIQIPPEETPWGPRVEGLVRTMSRFGHVPIEETLPTPLFQGMFGVEPEVGAEVAYQYWNSTVIEVTEESTTVRHNPENGSVIPVNGGNVTITYNETTVTMEFVPLINVTFIAPDGTPVTVIWANETHMVADYNNPLAGKNMEVEIHLEEVSPPVKWHTDIDEALSLSKSTGRPVFILFTNTTCVTCRRIELETLTHPFMLALKDSFIWTEIDPGIQRNAADRYGVSELPTILVLKDGKEIKRITTFLSADSMRAELESALPQE
ncbi:MAG: hypothetical protein D6733_03935 [Methanobacteriota archaeon]|nr:MAG: hypothetical protein D6733_03935 [Euryarchaeota archaeon]